MSATHHHKRPFHRLTIAALLLALLLLPIVVRSVWNAHADVPTVRPTAPPVHAAPSVAQAVPAGARAAPAGARAAPAGAQAAPTVGKVQIHVREGIGTLDSGMRTPLGAPIGVPCGTCHEAHRQPPFVRNSADLKDFHRGVQVSHGNQPCAACHSLEDRDRLHLADGKTIPFTEVVTLCSQCHGPQARDYAHGAHGGMNGYWNLAQGGRQRNSCVDCHAAHAPAFPHFKPALKPRDRFLDDRTH